MIWRFCGAEDKSHQPSDLCSWISLNCAAWVDEQALPRDQCDVEQLVRAKSRMANRREILLRLSDKVNFGRFSQLRGRQHACQTACAAVAATMQPTCWLPFAKLTRGNERVQADVCQSLPLVLLDFLATSILLYDQRCYKADRGLSRFRAVLSTTHLQSILIYIQYIRGESTDTLPPQ